MHWNKIKGKGSCELASALKGNSHLLIFDASFNSFGSGQLQKKPIIIRSKVKLNIDKMSKLQKFGVVPDETRYIYNKSKDNEEFTMSASNWAKAIFENKSLVHIDFSFN